MNISSVGASESSQAMSEAAGVDNKRMQLQMLMLRKSLDSQQTQAEELARQLEGKGQVIDLRV